MRLRDVKEGMKVILVKNYKVNDRGYDREQEAIKKAIKDKTVFTVLQVWGTKQFPVSLKDFEYNVDPFMLQPYVEVVEFKVGDTVKALKGVENFVRQGDIGVVLSVGESTLKVKWQDPFDTACDGTWFINKEKVEHVRPAAAQKRAENIAPILWNAYKDRLNPEALAALRQVIEDVGSHKKIVFNDSEDINLAFLWGKTAKGYDFWFDVLEGNYDLKYKAINEEETITDEGMLTLTEDYSNPSKHFSASKPEAGKIRSDGGSSDYYVIDIVRQDGATFQCQVNDVIYALVNGDFDLSNVIKATRRMYLDSRGGGKEGVDLHYDAKKIHYFVNDFEARFGKKD